jgi:hypothetical protein
MLFLFDFVNGTAILLFPILHILPKEKQNPTLQENAVAIQKNIQNPVDKFAELWINLVWVPKFEIRAYAKQDIRFGGIRASWGKLHNQWVPGEGHWEIH